MTGTAETLVSLTSTIYSLISSGDLGIEALDALVTIVSEKRSKNVGADELINEIVMTRMLSPDTAKVYDFLVGLGLISLTDEPRGITESGRAIVQILVDEAAATLEDGSAVSDAAALLLEKVVLHFPSQPIDVWIEAVFDEIPRMVSKLAANILVTYQLAEYEEDAGWIPLPLGLLVLEKIGQQTGSED